MTIRRFDKATGTVIDLGRHHGRLRMIPGDVSVAFFFEFQKLQRIDAAEATEGIWERLVINPYSDIPRKNPSEIIDVADEYMFRIRGYNKGIFYEIWPKKRRADTDTLRPAYIEKKKWMAHFHEAHKELEEYSHGRGKGPQQPIKIEYIKYPLYVKKGKETDRIDRLFVEFTGTIDKAIFATKKSPKFGYDNRLLELLVEEDDGKTYAIIRYRNDEHSVEINGFIDLGADGDKNESAWNESVSDLVPSKGNKPPTATKLNQNIASGKKGHIIHGKEGRLTLVMKDRRRDGKPRKYEFKIPGSQAGVEFYDSVMIYAKDWKVKKLESKDEPEAFGYSGGAARRSQTAGLSNCCLPSQFEISLREGNLGDAQTILDGLTLPDEFDPEKFLPIRKRGGGMALATCFPKMEWSILHKSMNEQFLGELIQLSKMYIDQQIALVQNRDTGLAVVKKLKEVVESLKSSAVAYRAAFEIMNKEAVFADLMTVLNGLSARASRRCLTACGGSKPKQTTGALRTVYQHARHASTIFEDLLDALGKWSRENPSRADAKNPFRALEKCGLDKKRLAEGWNFSSLTDIVRGAITFSDSGEAKQLVDVLMACDDHQQAYSSLKGSVQDIRDAIGGRALAIVGVKNRFSTGSVSGEWRDVQIKFYFESDSNKHVCEIQLMHRLLANVREQGGRHEIYDAARNALELLDYTGRSV